ncbi:MAG TPA: homoserine kinase, partial [Firmicutes bacterium]|nr:homoserine kinase [Bacillota bacterium]
MGQVRTVRVTVPATTANLGPGFDCLGLALELRNAFTLSAEGWKGEPDETGLVVTADGEGSRTLAKDGDNLVYRAAQAVFARAGRHPAALHIHVDCRIPLGRGLGSSASAIVGGVWGAAALLGEAGTTAELLALAAELEGHPDNVLPAALGGFTVAVPGSGGQALRWVRVGTGENLRAVLAVPSFSLRTSEARRRLPRQVPFGDAVFNVGRTAALVAAAVQGDWLSAAAAMEDRLHQPYRAPLVPGFEGVCRAAR